MPFKEKAIVRHKLRPDWGAGRVMSRSDEYLQIDFTAGGLIKLKTSIADDHLEAASDEEARALKPPKVKAKRAVVAPVEEAPKGAVGLKAAVAAKAATPAKGLTTPKSIAPAKNVVPAKSVAPAKNTPAKSAAPKGAAPKSAPAKSAAAKTPAKSAAKASAKGGGKSAAKGKSRK